MGTPAPSTPLPHDSGVICQHSQMPKASCPLPSPPGPHTPFLPFLPLRCSFLSIRKNSQLLAPIPQPLPPPGPFPLLPGEAALPCLHPHLLPPRWSSERFPGALLPTYPIGGAFDTGHGLVAQQLGTPGWTGCAPRPPSWGVRKPTRFIQDTGIKLPAEDLINSALN